MPSSVSSVEEGYVVSSYSGGWDPYVLDRYTTRDLAREHAEAGQIVARIRCGSQWLHAGELVVIYQFDQFEVVR